MNVKKKRIFILTALFLVLGAVLLWMVWGNRALTCNTHTVSSAEIPESFQGYRIAQVSDLHNTKFGKGNEKLLTMLREADPDMIAITGDLIDSRRTNIETALEFARQAIQIAPCYYVTGNHEARIDEYPALKQGLLDLGLVILENDCVELTQKDAKIFLAGVEDPSFQTDYLRGDSQAVMQENLAQALSCSDGFTILLSHRPELMDVYAENNVSLVLSGHAHGGQFRLPFVGGLFAPNQGLLPEYDAGIYHEENTAMVVSRGLGNSIFPLRFNNCPELIVVELEHIG